MTNFFILCFSFLAENKYVGFEDEDEDEDAKSSVDTNDTV